MASLFSALTTAVSGLNAQSSAIGNISDNLANAQTTGYKAVGTDFEDLVNASNSYINNPGGVRALPAYQNDVQGSITSSNLTTNLAISGEGYFATQTASTNAAGATTFNSQQFYTRQGDFTLDKNGYLVNGSGYYLDAYPVAAGATDTSQTKPVQVSALLDNPVPTSNVTYDANLPSNATAGYTSSPSTVQVYDALGNSHDVTYTWTKEAAANSWSLNVTAPDAKDSAGNPYNATIPVTFNDGTGGTTGTIASFGAYSATDVPAGDTNPNSQYTPPAVTPPATAPATGAAANLGISLNFSGTGTQAVSLNFGNFGESTGLTQFSDSNSTVSVTDFEQNGLARGSFNSFAISQDGLVSINYSNGTTQTIAQIPVVQFYAQDQLQRVTGGAYTSTLAAGTPRYGIAGSNGGGTISSSSLEQSNVDIATEFTDLIQAQQVYSANAKVVTTDDTLLQTTVNMIQS